MVVFLKKQVGFGSLCIQLMFITVKGQAMPDPLCLCVLVRNWEVMFLPAEAADPFILWQLFPALYNNAVLFLPHPNATPCFFSSALSVHHLPFVNRWMPQGLFMLLKLKYKLISNTSKASRQHEELANCWSFWPFSSWWSGDTSKRWLLISS